MMMMIDVDDNNDDDDDANDDLVSTTQENAELAVRDMLREIASKKPSSSASSSTSFLKAVESMDEGAEIHLRVEIDAETGSAVFDFGATSIEQFGNINAPRAVTLSAVIYCLRCMVGYDVPLNQVWRTYLSIRCCCCCCCCCFCRQNNRFIVVFVLVLVPVVVVVIMVVAVFVFGFSFVQLPVVVDHTAFESVG